MSRKYKFLNQEGLYFVSFATVYWMDIMVREDYFNLLINSLDYCRKNLGLQIFCYCIMPSHIHLIMRASDNNPAQVLGRFKEFTSKALRKSIADNPQESRKEWLLWMMERAAKKSSNVSRSQVWQHHNKPIELWSPEVIEQKVSYIHANPVVAGFVAEPWHWKYSSAIDYSGGKGLLEIDFIDG
ncbi:REP-associated tyrosine transposase [Flexithrix dorotheae]|uniref:REP-associated tyrosine transposase n=1 Tax=Flexithrix dorotheae TaxID=70993 RepID=UPI00038087A2|nr:transposase [Flexithrix dorotheae]